MSHIATIKTEITDLEALELACKELGLEFKEGQTSCLFRPQMNKTDTIPCSHAISLPKGQHWMELGLVKSDKGYNLVGDELLELHEEDDNGLAWARMIYARDTNPLGRKYGKLLQSYAVHKTVIEARRKGWSVKRTQVGAKVQLTVTGMN